ncbi:MAG: (d)CMP kinase [Lachnospiraceae bacterium]|nr:(d)CMP kinase [Lachnospiraceae bacterium]
MSYNVAIDGPAGAGKSTIAKRIAKEKGYIYVDTGAMYRAMAVYLLRKGIAPDDREGIEKACDGADISIEYRDGEQVVLLNGENVNPLLRTEEVGNMASASSVVPLVREKLVSLQQQLGRKADVVMDGRDIGTVVLPDADVKVYLTASPGTRAKRRFLELQEKGMAADPATIQADIEERDYRDMHRETSPLKQAEDAVLVDSSDMTIEQVVERILSLCR